MIGGSGYRSRRAGRATSLIGRALLAASAAILLPLPALAGADDIAACLEAKPGLQVYVDAFTDRGWTRLAAGHARHDEVVRATGEIIGTLRTFPGAFRAPQEVRTHVARIVEIGRRETSTPKAAFLSKDGRALMVRFEQRSGEARVDCYLSAKTLPDVSRRLPGPGRNPSGEPLAWNVASSGPLETPHIFAEVMYVRLFFQPAQHLLTGGSGIVTHLTFRRDATPT